MRFEKLMQMASNCEANGMQKRTVILIGTSFYYIFWHDKSQDSWLEFPERINLGNIVLVQ